MKPKTLFAGLSLAALAAVAHSGQGTSNKPPTPFVPRIQGVKLTFVNGADGKDGVTKLHVFIYPAGYKVGSDEKKGAIFGSMSSNASTPYAANSTTSVELSDYTSGNPVDLPTTLDQNVFVGTHGGRLFINPYRNGHDTWIVKAMSMSIRYQGGLRPRVVTFPGFTTKEGEGPVVIDFDENFQIVKR